MKVNNKVFIIVIGNAYNWQCRTIEILDTTLPSNNWKFGPILPYSSIYGSTLVTSPTNRGVIVIGGYTGKSGFGQVTNYLYELSGDSEENLTWSLLEQKLDVGRYLHLSLPIPNQLIPSQFPKQE